MALFICAFGVALITNAQLGTAPITSLPYVLTFITPLSIGFITFLMNCFFLAAQKFLLKKDFKKVHLAQLPTVFLLGAFIDFWMLATEPLISNEYIWQLAMCLAGSFVLGIGISLEIVCDAAVIPGEGLVIAIANKFKLAFPNIKAIFDVSIIIASIILAIFALDRVVGLREGTVISALLVAQSIKFNSRWTRKLKPLFWNAEKRIRIKNIQPVRK